MPKFTPACGQLDFSDRAVPVVAGLWGWHTQAWLPCGLKFPYAWLLSTAVAVAAAALLWPRRDSNRVGADGGRLPPPTTPARKGAPPPLPANTKLLGVRGWLLLLCVHLTIVSPLMIMWEVARTFELINSSFESVSGLESYFRATRVLALFLVLASIFVGVLLWFRRPGAHSVARWFLLFGLLVACVSPFSIYLFVDMPDEWSVGSVFEFGGPRFVAAVASTLAWYTYLLKSERVRANFGAG